MTASNISQLLQVVVKHPPATDAQVSATEDRLGLELPADYRAFLRECNGVEGFVGPSQYLRLWSASEIPENHVGYKTAANTPGLVLVGTDGGDIAYGFILGRSGYVRIPFLAISLVEAQPMGQTLNDLVRALGGK